MPAQFDRMKEIYRQAKHITFIVDSGDAVQAAHDTLKLIEELCTELARVTGKVREWAEFKKSLK